MVWVSLAIALLSVSANATGSQGGGLDVVMYQSGDIGGALLTNLVSCGMTGIHVEFDQPVTLVSKLEIGGYLPTVVSAAATAFDLGGGSLTSGGTLDLGWSPASATLVLVRGTWPCVSWPADWVFDVEEEESNNWTVRLNDGSVVVLSPGALWDFKVADGTMTFTTVDGSSLSTSGATVTWTDNTGKKHTRTYRTTGKVVTVSGGEPVFPPAP